MIVNEQVQPLQTLCAIETRYLPDFFAIAGFGIGFGRWFGGFGFVEDFPDHFGYDGERDDVPRKAWVEQNQQKASLR